MKTPEAKPSGCESGEKINRFLVSCAPSSSPNGRFLIFLSAVMREGIWQRGCFFQLLCCLPRPSPGLALRAAFRWLTRSARLSVRNLELPMLRSGFAVCSHLLRRLWEGRAIASSSRLEFEKNPSRHHVTLLSRRTLGLSMIAPGSCLWKLISGRSAVIKTEFVRSNSMVVSCTALADTCSGISQ